MHKVKQAIIMAAGLGKRLQPVTFETPKPLIRVNGTRMIDTIIRGLHANGINKIYIVVGYLREQFEELTEEYEGITIVNNPYYNECNNIASLYVARNYLEDALIIDGDQIIYNNDILTPEFEKSGYNAVWVEENTTEWIMQVQRGKVISCSRTGGENGWQLYSVSRWTAEDGVRLKRHLEEEFEEKNNRKIYWDDVVMFCHFEEYDLGIMPMRKEDIVEIDSLKELIAMDSSYSSKGDCDGKVR